MDPNDALQAMLQPVALKTIAFAPTSRYHGIKTATLESPDGTVIVYVRRRFLPQFDRLVLVQEYQVKQGDRLDNLAAQFIGDPEQFWRICDANTPMRPDELTETIGRRLRITLPEGVPGMPNG
ncbi:MAG: LysM domain-containing protein [Chloroflexota bacterium]|nr:MAG: LysM domain-containing protein [Chloroflexota bacterium]